MRAKNINTVNISGRIYQHDLELKTVKNQQWRSPTPHKEVFVSRTKFPVFLPKASQGDSLAAFCGFNTRNFQFLRNCEAL